MDIYSYLESDHNSITDQTDLLVSNKNLTIVEKRDLTEKLCFDTYSHICSEEKVFYDSLKHDREMIEFLQNSHKEHKEIENAIFELINFRINKPIWKRALLKFKNQVQQHFRKEENLLFMKAKTLLDPSTTYYMVSQMKVQKEMARRDLKNLLKKQA